MNNEFLKRFLEPSTPEEMQSMLLILATSIHEALNLLPETGETSLGLAILRQSYPCTLRKGKR